MLIELICDGLRFARGKIPRGRILFQPGLNIIPATNAESMSAFLMIIDYIFGSNDLITNNSSLQAITGSSSIKFAFQFQNSMFYFSRSVLPGKKSNYIQKCDSDYNPLEDGLLTMHEYLSFLSRQYSFNYDPKEFRDVLELMMRISGRNYMNSSKPLQHSKNESDKKAIEQFLKQIDRSAEIEALFKERKSAEEELKSLENKLMYAGTPAVNDFKEYKRNAERMSQLTAQVEEIEKNGITAILDPSSASKAFISEKKNQLSRLIRYQIQLKDQLYAIREDRQTSPNMIKDSYDNLMAFFPGVDLQKIDSTEQFHNQIATILADEFTEAEQQLRKRLTAVEADITSMRASIETEAGNKDFVHDFFEQYHLARTEYTTLQQSNEYFDMRNDINARKDSLNRTILNKTASELYWFNHKMNEFCHTILDNSYSAPILYIQDVEHYYFENPFPDSSGLKNLGLLLFDLALATVTKIPVIAHDSVLFRQLDVHTVKNLLSVYKNMPEQIFVALENANEYIDSSQRKIEVSEVSEIRVDNTTPIKTRKQQ